MFMPYVRALCEALARVSDLQMTAIDALADVDEGVWSGIRLK